MVASSGAWLYLLVFQRYLYSNEWFFFATIARRRGEMIRMVMPAPTMAPQYPSILLVTNGMKYLMESSSMAMVSIE